MPTQLPPGLTAEGPIIGRYDGGQENWFKYESIKLYTNAFIREDGRVDEVSHPPREYNKLTKYSF